MRSRTPKPLHRLCGRPMVLHVLDTLAQLRVERVVVVVGHGANEVTKVTQAEAPESLSLEFVEQPEQLGTGDAAAVGLTGFPDLYADIDDADLLVLPADTPLVRASTLAALVRCHRQAGAAATLVTAELDDPLGCSRVIRDKSGGLARVVDDADLMPDEETVEEVASHVYCFRHGVLAPVLRRLAPDPATGEYRLISAVEVLHDAGYVVSSVLAPDPVEAVGVNDRAQLAAAEAQLRARLNARWMRRGVTMADPRATYLDTTVSLAADVTLLPGVVLEGRTTVGEGSVVGPDTRLVDCAVGAGARVEQSRGERATIGDDAVVGPYAVLEPGAEVAAGDRVGPFFKRG